MVLRRIRILQLQDPNVPIVLENEARVPAINHNNLMNLILFAAREVEIISFMHATASYCLKTNWKRQAAASEIEMCGKTNVQMSKCPNDLQFIFFLQIRVICHSPIHFFARNNNLTTRAEVKVIQLLYCNLSR